MLAPLSFLAAVSLATQDLPLAPLERIQQEAIAYAEAQTRGGPGTYTFKVLRPPLLPQAQGALRFEVSHLSKREPTGNFFIVFRIFAEGRPLNTVRVDLEGQWKGPLLRTRTALPGKTIPTEDQLETITFEGAPPPGALTELPKECRLRVAVAPGHILTQSDLQPIPLINAGDMVRVELVCGPLTLATDALARSSGARGEKIRLELLSSRKHLQAVVTAPGQAEVRMISGKM